MNNIKNTPFYDISLVDLVNNDISLLFNHTSKAINLLVSEQNKFNLLGTDYIAYRYLFIDNSVQYTDNQLLEYLNSETTKFSCKNILITNNIDNSDDFILNTEIRGNDAIYR